MLLRSYQRQLWQAVMLKKSLMLLSPLGQTLRSWSLQQSVQVRIRHLSLRLLLRVVGVKLVNVEGSVEVLLRLVVSAALGHLLRLSPLAVAEVSQSVAPKLSALKKALPLDRAFLLSIR